MHACVMCVCVCENVDQTMLIKSKLLELLLVFCHYECRSMQWCQHMELVEGAWLITNQQGAYKGLYAYLLHVFVKEEQLQ